MSPDKPNPSADRLIEAIAMLTARIDALEKALSRPRKTRAQVTAEKYRKYLERHQ